MKAIVIILCIVLFATSQSYSQTETSTFGLGIGFDYGGFGANYTAYPNKNVGLYAGLGYALAGVGANGGVKYRFVSKKSKVAPFLTAMYGYNTAVVVSNAARFDKFFYGPTVGFGLDLFRDPRASGYWSFALLVPIRGSDVDSYINDLKSQNIVISSPSPVGFSVGYRFIID